MAIVFMDGFDKYGGPNTYSAGVIALLTSGEWTGATFGTYNIVAPLSATGQALTWSPVNGSNLQKTFPTNYPRLIGGIRFTSTLSGTQNAAIIGFGDNGSGQCAVALSPTGSITLRNAGSNGTVLGTVSNSISANSTHYLEWDITFSNTGAYQLWLDGVSVLTGSGDTTTTANNYANQIYWIGAPAGIVMTFDDLYLFDATGPTNNAVLLTSPRIETTFPASDSASVQFSSGAGILGSSICRFPGTYSPGFGNGLWLKRYTPATACTLNSISVVPITASGAANLRGVVYADSAGAAGALMSSGTTVTGTTANTMLLLPLTTPQNLSAGVQYWIGFMTDTILSYQQNDANNSGYIRTSVTFASGAPGTAGAMTPTQISWLGWGNLTGVVGNYDMVNSQPVDGQYSYVVDSVVGHEDLYNFTTLSQPLPAMIHAVAVKAYAQKSDSGVSTISMRMKSAAVDSAGSLAGQATGTTFGWFASYFSTDPNTSTAWTGATLNAALSGFKIDS